MDEDDEHAALAAQEQNEHQQWEHERMTTPHVYTAIAEVTAAIAKTGIAKDRNNQQQGYKFRGIDDVYNALSAHLSAAKLSMLPRVLSREVTERQTKTGGVLFYVVLAVEFDLVSAVDASKHTITVYGEAMDSGDKATNKAMSAAYKYAAMQAFCIPTEGDNDADATTHEVAPKHDPRDDLPPADPDAVRAAVEIIRKAWTLDADEDGIALAVFDAHEALRGDQAVYVAAIDEYAKTTPKLRSGWKELVKRGRELANQIPSGRK